MPVLKKEDIRRTIIFALDDLSMNFEEGYCAKMALRKFVEKQMQIGDMVAVLQSGYGNKSDFQMFHSDKRELLARIDVMRLEMNNGRMRCLNHFFSDQLIALTHFALRRM